MSVEKRLLELSVCCPFFIRVLLRATSLDSSVVLNPILLGAEDLHDSVQPSGNACQLKLQVLMIASERCKLASEIAPFQLNRTLGLLQSSEFPAQINIDL